MFPVRRSIELVDHPKPELRHDHDVKLRILEVGICGTDKEIARFDYGTAPEGSDYLVLGHESLGEVVEVGDQVEGVAPGDLAVLMVRRPCPHEDCLACRNGRQDFCYTGDFTERGIQKQHGFMTELVVDRDEYVVRLDPGLRELGVLTEPLTIAEKALLQIREIQERLPWTCRDARQAGRAADLDALVLGAGPVGLLGAMALANAGFRVTVFSKNASDSVPARIVEGIGGRYLSAQDHDAAELTDVVGCFDVVYEATGAASVAFEVLRALDANAVFVFTGVPGRKAPIEVDTSTLMRDLVLRNQVVFGTVNAGRDAFDAAVTDLATFRTRWPEQLAALITGRYGPERYAELLHGELAGIKNVIRFD